MLHDSEEYRFIVVEENGIVQSYSPRLIRGDIQTMVYVSYLIIKGILSTCHLAKSLLLYLPCYTFLEIEGAISEWYKPNLLNINLMETII